MIGILLKTGAAITRVSYARFLNDWQSFIGEIGKVINRTLGKRKMRSNWLRIDERDLGDDTEVRDTGALDGGQ